MQTRSHFLNEIARMAGGAANTVSAVKEEVELRVRERVERILNEMDLVTREEFEAMSEMATRARTENEELSKKLTLLEDRLKALEATSSANPDETRI